MKKTATRSSLREATATVVVPARFSADAAPTEANDDLGHRLKRVRIDKGWTLKEVSERTGVARSTLSKIENGQMSPTYDVLQKITRGVDLDIVELFDQRRQNAPFGRRSVTRSGEGKPHRTDTYRLRGAGDRPFAKAYPAFQGADQGAQPRRISPAGCVTRARSSCAFCPAPSRCSRNSTLPLRLGSATAPISTARWATPSCR